MKVKIEQQEEAIRAWRERAEAAEKALREAQAEIRYFESALKWSSDPKYWYLARKTERQADAIRQLHKKLEHKQSLPGAEHPAQATKHTIREPGYELLIDRPPRQKRQKITWIIQED